MQVNSIQNFSILNKMNNQKNRNSVISNANVGQMSTPLDSYKKQISFGKLNEVLGYFQFEDLENFRNLLESGDQDKLKNAIKKLFYCIPLRVKEKVKGSPYKRDAYGFYTSPPDRQDGAIANKFLKEVQESLPEFNNYFDLRKSNFLRKNLLAALQTRDVANNMFYIAATESRNPLFWDLEKLPALITQKGKDILKEVGTLNKEAQESFYDDGVLYKSAIENGHFELANIIFDESEKLGPEVMKKLLECGKSADYLKLLTPKPHSK